MEANATRTRWAAIGAAVAVALGAGGIGLVSATSPAGAVAYVPLGEPCRAADTRPDPQFNIGPRDTPLGADDTHTINANDGDCAGKVAASATSVLLNITAVDATAATFLTIWASGPRPDASSLNPAPGQPPVPNAVTTAITGANNFEIFNRFGSVHVIVDVIGYFIDHDHDDRYYTKAEVESWRHAEVGVVNFTDVLTSVLGAFEFTAPADGSLLVDVSCRMTSAAEPIVRFGFRRQVGGGTSTTNVYIDPPSGSAPVYYARFGYDLAEGESATYSVLIANETDATEKECNPTVVTMEFIPDS